MAARSRVGGRLVDTGELRLGGEARGHFVAISAERLACVTLAPYSGHFVTRAARPATSATKCPFAALPSRRSPRGAEHPEPAVSRRRSSPACRGGSCRRT